jgi:luciferase family oxidoreductase group 1
MLGLPFAFASHFAPQQMRQALDIYRDRFKPSEQLERPYVMLGFNICAADTNEEANYLRSSSLQSFLNLRKGTPGQLPPPIANFEERMEPQDKAMLSQMGVCSAVGTGAEVAQGMSDFIEQTSADELMLVSSIFDHEKRKYSFGLAARAGQ